MTSFPSEQSIHTHEPTGLSEIHVDVEIYMYMHTAFNPQYVSTHARSYLLMI